ncbi:YMGG-like glycine zipper-containing protein [Achromobacter deleyi]|uniref:YMGG-like glycine zipper-containing protein n=1 Tax=Achromobacter deleyi TaxID=1353891 RepID=UPI001F2C85A8|nr:YMGG-like glycine zipper-containing protein [Achromobacter deleyi]UIP22615.1 YMGG-like glycine zipper-containing protein [Achromobacter deleyi]
MKKSIFPCTAPLLSMFCLCAAAQTVTPLKGQSPETTQQDIATCQAQAGSPSSASTDSPQAGGRARGAAAGAAAGATVAGARGRQHEEVYDRVDDDVKQEYRQNQAKDAAVAGMVVGGSRQRQDRRQDRGNAAQENAAISSAYGSCMQQRGYQVTP